MEGHFSVFLLHTSCNVQINQDQWKSTEIPPERGIDCKVEDLRQSYKETDIDSSPQHGCASGTLISSQFLIQRGTLNQLRP